MKKFFPIIQNNEELEYDESLPLYREVLWDYEKKKPIFQSGNPVYVTGLEAVRVWAWKALATTRDIYEIYSKDFGSELESLIGQNYSEDLKRAEAARYVKEALEVNPYISDISDINVLFDNGTLQIELKIETVYGEAKILV